MAEVKHSIYFVSLGCDKNRVDSEYMIAMLQNRGYSITDELSKADTAVVNTCCFIGDAAQESMNTVLELAELRKSGALKALIYTGCLAQRYRKEIRESIPEVDSIIGTAAIDKIVEALDGIYEGKAEDKFEELSVLRLPDVDRVNTTGGYTGYLKISEGCNKRCTYCVIPYIRGPYRSVPMERLEKEAAYMAKMGIKELILVAQETTLYGKDIYGKKMLPELLHRLCKIYGIEWIRVLYCYPEEITDELIDCIMGEEKICKYLDLPIQHASDAILKKMGRLTDQASIVNVIEKLRAKMPEVALRTTLITGFPGETEEDFEVLLKFVEKMRFDRLGAFPYSKEEGTPAAKMKGQVLKKIKVKRRDEVMKLQQRIVFDNNKKLVGKKERVIIEGRLADEIDYNDPEMSVYVARTYRDAPGIDGSVFIKTKAKLESGMMPLVEITGANGYDLLAKLV